MWIRQTISLLTVLLLLAGCSMPMHGPVRMRLPRQYDPNGELIYFTGTSRSNTPITFDMHGGGMMGGMVMRGGMGCADCHGPEGRGRSVQMMMTSFTAPDIRYTTLTSEEMAHGPEEGDGHDGEKEHPPYTDETIKRAITQGIDPAGEPLAWPMPRWSMSDEDLDDLITYLKMLE